MSEAYTIRYRRSGVVIMFAAVIALFTLFLFGEYSHWNGFLISGTLLSGLAVWVSFQMTLKKTGLWKMCRLKARKLDEREKIVVLNSYRRSYFIFAVVSLILVFLIVLSVRYHLIIHTHRGHFSLGLALVMFLDFLVSMLPPSVIAWTESVVEKEIHKSSEAEN
jgi:hypothetical protein